MAGMSQRTSLVHPSTAKLDPDNQAKGVYTYTSPLVLAYLRGEKLDDSDMRVVVQHYADLGVAMPLIKLEEPALADEFYSNKGGGTASVDEVQRPRKATRKVVSMSEGRVVDAVAILVDGLSEKHAEAIFNRLANKLGYSVE